MSERRIVVPEAMLEAVDKERVLLYGPASGWQFTQEILEAALGWVTEEPIVPTPAQLAILGQVYACNTSSADYHDSLMRTVIEWQRLMFLAPEPEVPEDLAKKVDDLVSRGWSKCDLSLIVLEAFRRGKASR